MQCPSCANAKTEVRDSRPFQTTIYRRRFCLACKRRFTTLEVSEDDPVFQRLKHRDNADTKQLLDAVDRLSHWDCKLLVKIADRFVLAQKDLPDAQAQVS